MEEQNPNPNLTLEISEPALKDGAHYYPIKLTDKQSKKVYTRLERYSEMRSLHKDLTDSLGSDRIPNFPKKRWFGSKDTNFISQRKQELKYYFVTLVNQYPINQPELAPLKSFLITKAKVTKMKETESEQNNNDKPDQQKPENKVKSNQNLDQETQQQQQNGKNNNNNNNNQQTENQQQKVQKPDPIIQQQNKFQKMQEINENLNDLFINMMETFTLPSELEAKRKRAEYDQLRFDYKYNLTNKYTVPAGSPSNISNPQILAKSTNEFNAENKMDELASNLLKSLNLPDIKADPTQIVHKISLKQD